MSVISAITIPGLALLSYIIPFIIALIVIVFIHELGHFVVARFFGVKVEAFSIGFGKELLTWKDSKGTVWKFCLLPLGGYVKFEGDANGASFPTADQDISTAGNFHGKPVWQRALVVAAGPIANFLLAIAIFAAAFMTVGIPAAEPKVGAVRPGSAAEEAGLKAGDIIRQIDGREIRFFGDIQKYVHVRPGQEMMVQIERGSSTFETRITPRVLEQPDNFGGTLRVGVFGIEGGKVADATSRRLSPLAALSEATGQTWNIVWTTLRYVGKMFRGEESTKMIGGPAMIAKGAGDAAAAGFAGFASFVAFISVSIGLVNLFPVPMLDGGHLVFYAIEAIRGKPLGAKAQEWGFRIGVSFVLMLMLLGTSNDIMRLISMSMKS
jgi:regulator of sigma E protease